MWLLILAPAVAGATLLLGRRFERYAAAISVTAAAVMLVSSIVVGFARPELAVAFMAGTEFALRID
ncbi:NADH-quinone oxidoreductase subunit L, partial [Mycobacterium tuberculosis]|nr:NADH-quinone oxidoreductase subunit L [Mycobacterium tuberculosis]